MKMVSEEHFNETMAQIFLRFDQQDDMFGRIFKKFDQIDQRFDHLEKNVDANYAELKSVNMKMHERATSLEKWRDTVH